MIILYIIIAVFVVAIIAGVISGIKKSNALSAEIKTIGATEGLYAKHVEGLGLGHTECRVFRFDDRILINSASQKFEILLNQLRAAEVKSEQELIEKGKSVVGRALIGTLLVPGLGTIVGGMSGIGSKKKNGKTNHYMILNYTDSKGDLAAVTFQVEVNFVMKGFCNNLNKSIPRTQEVVRL